MKNIILVTFIALVLSSCSSTTIGVIVSNVDFQRLTIGNKPPEKVTDTLMLNDNLVTNEVVGVSVSPNGLFAVLWTKKSSSNTDKIRVYNTVNGNLEYTADQADIKRQLERATDYNYDGITRFVVLSLRWYSEETLIVDALPSVANTGIESVPANVSIAYNLKTKRVEEVGLYPRNTLPRLPEGTFPNRNVYSHSISNSGELLIDGNKIQGVPGIVRFADITTIKQ